jgi:hypothetical protein
MIWCVHSPLDPTTPVADPNEPVRANEKEPRGLPVLEQIFK